MFAAINETVSRRSQPVLLPFLICRWSDWRVRGPLFVSPSMTSMCQGNRGEASPILDGGENDVASAVAVGLHDQEVSSWGWDRA